MTLTAKRLIALALRYGVDPIAMWNMTPAEFAAALAARRGAR